MSISKDKSEGLNNVTNAAKNTAEIISMLFQPRGIKAAILEGHNKIIEEITQKTEFTIEEKSSY